MKDEIARREARTPELCPEPSAGHPELHVLAAQLAALAAQTAASRNAAALDASDILHGAKAIGAVLGVTYRQVYHFVETSRLPVFRMGGTLCARRSVLAKWIADQEAASVSGGRNDEA